MSTSNKTRTCQHPGCDLELEPEVRRRGPKRRYCAAHTSRNTRRLRATGDTRTPLERRRSQRAGLEQKFAGKVTLRVRRLLRQAKLIPKAGDEYHRPGDPFAPKSQDEKREKGHAFWEVVRPDFYLDGTKVSTPPRRRPDWQVELGKIARAAHVKPRELEAILGSTAAESVTASFLPESMKNPTKTHTIYRTELRLFRRVRSPLARIEWLPTLHELRAMWRAEEARRRTDGR
jgi:hypothetical protein